MAAYAESKQTESLYRPANFGSRAGAYLIDILIVVLGTAVVKVLCFPVQVLMPGWLSSRILFTMTLEDIMIWFLVFVYFSVTTWRFGATVGKMIMGLQVISTENRGLTFGEVLYREIPGRFLTTVSVIGYFMATGNRKHQTLHDMLSDTQVVYGRKKIVPVAEKTPMELYTPDAASEYGL